LQSWHGSGRRHSINFTFSGSCEFFFESAHVLNRFVVAGKGNLQLLLEIGEKAERT
jgi:hypothetical protein